MDLVGEREQLKSHELLSKGAGGCEPSAGGGALVALNKSIL